MLFYKLGVSTKDMVFYKLVISTIEIILQTSCIYNRYGILKKINIIAAVYIKNPTEFLMNKKFVGKPNFVKIRKMFVGQYPPPAVLVLFGKT